MSTQTCTPRPCLGRHFAPGFRASSFLIYSLRIGAVSPGGSSFNFPEAAQGKEGHKTNAFEPGLTSGAGQTPGEVA